MAYWDSAFSRPGLMKVAQKRYFIAYTWILFLAPTAIVLVGSYPRLQIWFADTYRPLEYPPQADPQIISAIYHNRAPRASSVESYKKEVSKASK